MTTVDRHRWIRDRVRFLQARLEDGVSDEERSAIEAEIDELRHESGTARRWLRRVAGLPWRPTDR